MKTIGLTALYSLGYTLPLLIVVIHIQHFLLLKRFDEIWFNDKYFSPGEIAIYSSYPLSIVRSISYSCAICLPFTVKKRYKDLSPARNSSKLIKSISYLWLLLFILLSLTMVTIGVIALSLP